MKRMRKVCAVCLALPLLSLSLCAGDKEKDEETFKNGANVLREMLDSKAVPSTLIAKADCVIVLPGVKKVGLGIGGSGGRGPMSCRTGKKFDGRWSAPAMLRVRALSAGLQIGGSSTDFVLLIMSENGANAIVKGKTKLGNQASVAAGPSGGSNVPAIAADVLTYGRTEGMFAGMSMGGATLQPDDDANERLYGKPITASDIVLSSEVATQAGGEPLVRLLDSHAGKRPQ
jgi:SH3 domain-containing YSC84-like protein 1